MGAYLSKPVTDIETTAGQGRNYEYAAASMQGWRVRQEDAHVCLTNFDDAKGLSLFGVFDGHGGPEVSAYCAQKLAQHILENEHYLKGDLRKALSSSFLSFDLKLLEPETLTSLNELAGHPETKDQEHEQDQDYCSEEDPEDINRMLEEATMPIDAIMENYKKRIESGEGSSDQTDVNAPSSDLSSLLKGSKPVKDEKKSPEKNGEHESSKEVNDTLSGSSSSTAQGSSTQEKGCEENGQTETKESTKDTSSCGGSSSSSADSPVKVCEKNGEAESKTDGLVVKEKSGKSSGKTTRSEKAILHLRTSERLQSAIQSAIHHTLENSSFSSSDEDDSDMDSDGDSSSDCSDSSAASTLVLDSESDRESTFGDLEDSKPSPYNENIVEEDSKPSPYNENLVGSALDSGTTAIVAILGEDEITVANVGDSRAIIGRSLGRDPGLDRWIEAMNLSFDHKPESQTEMTRIQAAGGCVDRNGRVMGGLNLSRALGDHSNKQRKDLPQEKQMISAEPDIKTLSLCLPKSPEETSDKFLFMACDGIWNSLSSQDAAEFIWERMKTQMPITNILKELFNTCLARDTRGDGTGCDNMTAILVKFVAKDGDKPEDDSDHDTFSWESNDSDDEVPDEAVPGEVDADEEDRQIMPPPSKVMRLRRN